MNPPAVSCADVPEDAVLLDVREQDEWDAGHAPGAVHIPMSELAGRLADVPDGGEIYVICRVGGRSARVTQYLNGNGWEAKNVDGGMQSWAALGRPLVTDSGAEPQVI
ncbi:rhodanese-like domain-containing protein [Actinokineospora iranica]|uniref:Rhodanese-related sulfurtransferase n=1 Tax=Actinokineospora iranica TaxID=1271860 RepID=A0A1G6PBI8_9PSEU|nr:rhodanese-like domain-containing protein [Actinokineospora iranica]SDC77630.1 Rhodanese-related sulfurtransferase [Actinokineospora iranica]